MSELTFPGLRGQPPAIILPLTRMADAVRGEVFARAFMAAGWRVCLYVPENDQGLRQRAARPDGVQVLPVAFDTLASASQAKAFLIEATALVGLPRCLVTAPFEFDEWGGDRSESSALAGDEDASGAIDERLLRATRVNVAVPLALTRAFHFLHADVAVNSEAESKSAAGLPVHPSVIHLLDVDPVRITEARLVFALSQQSLLSAIPTLASAYAPGLRVVGLRTPLGQKGVALALQQADALIYLAHAGTVTGSSLLLDGGLRAVPPITELA